MLGELVELLGLLDRALALNDRADVDVRVLRAFSAAASDRNLAIIAQSGGRDARRTATPMAGLCAECATEPGPNRE